MKIKITEPNLDAIQTALDAVNPALWPDKLPSFDGHALTPPKEVSLTRALALLRLFAHADYLQWYWDASHTVPAPDVGQRLQDDMLLLACGQCVTHHHAGCMDILMAVPNHK